MGDVIQQLTAVEMLGNDLFSWCLALGSAALLYLVITGALRFLRSRVARLQESEMGFADDLVDSALASTRRIVVLLVALWSGSRFLELGPVERPFDLLVLVAATLQAAVWANTAVREYIGHFSESRRETDPGTVSAVQGMSFVVRLAIWVVAFLLVVDNLGYDVTALVAGLGIGGIALALAVQNILGDLFASFSIIMDKPFVVGDFIIVDDLLGVVEKIGIKTTRLRSLSGEQLVFSNSDLLNSRVRNFKRMYERRVLFNFGVVYQTTPEQLESIPPMIEKLIGQIENTRFDRAHFKAFGESSYDFEVVYYVCLPDYAIYMDVQQTINLGICRAFREHGIEFAYPTRTLYVNQPAEGAGAG